MKTTIQRSFLALATASLLAGSLAAQATMAERIAETRTNYKVDLWPQGQMRDGITLGSMQIPGFVGGEIESQKGLISRSFVASDAPKDAAPAFLVEARVADTVTAAQDQAVLWLSGISSANLAPEDGRYGLELGEAGYVGPSGAGPKAYSWVSFVRGNVAVRVMNVDPRLTPDLDLPRVAQQLDGGITSRAPLADGAAVPKPEVAELTVQSTEVVAGAAVLLDFTVVDPIGATPHVAWSVGGTGQGYVEQREGGWYLFTTGPGEVTVTMEVTASTGTYAERSIELEVADD